MNGKTAKLPNKMKTLTIEEAALAIKEEREKQRYTKREVASWIDQPYQRLDQLEDPENKGAIANQQRAVILRKLLDKPVTEPVFLIGEE